MINSSKLDGKNYKTIILQAPAITGVFIYLNIPKSLKNSLQFLAPSLTHTADFKPL
jgi:hypothetical protein